MGHLSFLEHKIFDIQEEAVEPGQKFLTYSIEGDPLCIQGQGTPPKVGDELLQVRVRAVVPFPGHPDYLVVVLTPLPK